MKPIKVSLDKQVVSRKIAPKVTEALKKAGIEVEANYALYRCKNNNEWTEFKLMQYPFQYLHYIEHEIVKTYTTDEMLAVLPERIGDAFWIHVDKAGAHYLNDNFVAIAGFHVDHKTNIATALAKLVIWCGENGYLGGEG